MKILLFFLSLSIFTFGQNIENKKLNYILKKFSETSKNIYKLEYNVQRIDTFSNVKNRSIKGYALIVRVKQDKEFGYYFVGECFDYPNHQNIQNIYDGVNAFDINKKEKTYKLVRSVKGYPGEQMVMRIADMIFFPDEKYSKVLLTDETNDSYTIEYQFDDTPTFKNFRKIIEINKHSFLPMKFIMSGQDLGVPYSYRFILSNLKINEDVSNSVEDIERKLTSYTMLENKKYKKNKSIVGSVVPKFSLAKLSDQSMMDEIYKNKVTLLDFWQVWCGYCVESMPKIDSLYQMFSNQLDVIGIVTQDTIYAKKLIKKLKIKFNSLIGNKFVLDTYGVDSFPRYFLINKNGIIIKEYIGFSKHIENDIRKLLKK